MAELVLITDIRIFCDLCGIRKTRYNVELRYSSSLRRNLIGCGSCENVIGYFDADFEEIKKYDPRILDRWLVGRHSYLGLVDLNGCDGIHLWIRGIEL